MFINTFSWSTRRRRRHWGKVSCYNESWERQPPEGDGEVEKRIVFASREAGNEWKDNWLHVYLIIKHALWVLNISASQQQINMHTSTLKCLSPVEAELFFYYKRLIVTLKGLVISQVVQHFSHLGVIRTRMRKGGIWSVASWQVEVAVSQRIHRLTLEVVWTVSFLHF